jgi:hypothetical protein
MLDVKQIGDAVIATVKGHISNVMEGVTKRINDLEFMIKSIPAGAQGEKGIDGINGKDGSPGERGEPGSKGEKGDIGEKGEPGISGRDGIDGKDGAPGERGEPGLKGDQGDQGERGEKGDPGQPGQNGKDAEPELIKATISELIAEIPKPQDGKSITIEDVRPLIDDQIAKAVAAFPIPKDGRDGIDGKSITTEEIRGLLEVITARWEVDFERRAADVLQRAVDRIPLPNDGKDGRDAFELDDFDLSQSEDGRTVTLSFRRGDQIKEKTFTLDHPLDMGVYRPDATYAKGDGVTWGGSFFIAKKAGPVGKPGESDDWRLAVKRGQNGRDATPGEGKKIEPVRLK